MGFTRIRNILANYMSALGSGKECQIRAMVKLCERNYKNLKKYAKEDPMVLTDWRNFGGSSFLLLIGLGL